MKFSESLRRLLPGIWFGMLASIAFIATPAAFSAIDIAWAGLVVRRIFAVEAPVSLAFGVLIIVIERREAMARHMASAATQFSVEMMLAVAAVFCTVAGYYALQPMMEMARAGGPSALTFSQLHRLSTALFGGKGLLVLALAWKATRVRPFS